MTWPATEPEPAGTPRRPSRPTTTWPSNSAGSSSPRDFAAHALSRPPRKKPGPSSQPGPPPEHDQHKLRNTRARITVPKTYDSRQWRNAIARMVGLETLVQEAGGSLKG